MDDDRAWDLLDELVKTPGELRIITNLPDPNSAVSDPRDPAFNVLEDVIQVVPDGDVLKASSAGGAFTIGKPLDLLIRLCEHAHYDPQNPGATRERVLAALEERA